MKGIVYLLVLAALVYGGMWLYNNNYFAGFGDAVNNTVQRTSDFATDKAVQEANY